MMLVVQMGAITFRLEIEVYKIWWRRAPYFHYTYTKDKLRKNTNVLLHTPLPYYFLSSTGA